MTFSRNLGKFIFTSKGGIAVYERCASETFSFHQSLSLSSVPQHELRHGHQLSPTVWAWSGFELSLFSSQQSLFPTLSVTAQHSPGLSNTVRHWEVVRVNDVFGLKDELESSASVMVLVCLLGIYASGVVERETYI